MSIADANSIVTRTLLVFPSYCLYEVAMDELNMKFMRAYKRDGRLIRIGMTSFRDQGYALYVSNCALTDLAGTKSMHEKGVVDTGKSNYAEEKARVYGSAFIVTSNDMLKPCEWIIWLCDGYFHGSCSGYKLTGWFAIYIVYYQAIRCG